MIDLNFNGKNHLVSGPHEKLILEMLAEIAGLKDQIKKLKQRPPEIKDCDELRIIKINGGFHLVHPDVCSLIDSLEAKKNGIR